jgi:hypothetical protein
VTDGRGEQGREAGGTGRYTLALAFARVAGWIIVPLYVAGICTNYVLERGAGLLDETDYQHQVFVEVNDHV